MTLAELKAKFKAGQLTKEAYLAQVAALLAAKTITQEENDEAVKYDPATDDGFTPEQRTAVNKAVEDQIEERLGRQKASIYKQLGIKNTSEGKALIDAARNNKGADEATKAEVEALRRENTDYKVQVAVMGSPLIQTAHDPGLVYLKAKALLTFDPDTGAINNLKKTLDTVKTESPYLFRTEDGDNQNRDPLKGKPPGGGNPPAANPDQVKAQVDKNLAAMAQYVPGLKLDTAGK